MSVPFIFYGTFKKGISVEQDIVIIGGGFAGCFAAAKSALEGKKVTLIEQNTSLISWYSDKILSKLLGNSSRRLRFQSKMFNGASFVENALKLFSPQKCALQFEGIGIHTIEIDNEFIYPKESCSSVVQKISTRLDHCGVTVLLETTAGEITQADGSINAVAIKSNDKEFTIPTKQVILATGRTLSGVSLAEKAGHMIEPFQPLTAPIKLHDSPLGQFDRKSIPNVKLYLWSDGKKVSDARGDVIISDGTLSGSAPFILSPFVAKTTNATITLDLLPDIDEGAFDKGLIELCNENGAETIQTILARNVIPKWLTETIISSIAEIDCDTKGAEFTAKYRKKLRGALYRFPIGFSGLANNINSVIDYSGGVQVDSINAETMESYVVNGLYLAGEILNIDSQWGGFSIHNAMSTGRLAGMSASGTQC